MSLSHEQNVPVIFALGRKALGRAVNKLVPVSVVGVFNYDGAEVRLIWFEAWNILNPMKRFTY